MRKLCQSASNLMNKCFQLFNRILSNAGSFVTKFYSADFTAALPLLDKR